MSDKIQGEVDIKGLKEEKIPSKLEGEGHEVFFDIDGVPEKLYVGQSCSLVVFATCESGCDLVGDKLEIISVSGDEVGTFAFVKQEAELAVSEAIPFTMPDEPGKYQYIIHYAPREFPRPDDGGPAFKNPHPERDLLIEFSVEAHHVTVSTWGLTAPVWIGSHVEVHVGVSCSSGCSLLGQSVQVVDSDGTILATGSLKTPEEPRETLWWNKFSIDAPKEPKLHRWEARFHAEGLDKPHEDASHKFSFVARVPPERCLKIHVIDDKNDKPQRSARCEIKPVEGDGKPQFASTDVSGFAQIGAGKQRFNLKITAAGRKNFTDVIDLTEHDVTIEVHMQALSATADERIPLKILDETDGTAPQDAVHQETASQDTDEPTVLKS